jgi:CCR4-NOT transcription complex subunit 4
MPLADALRCIKALDGAVWKGKPVRACFGTTKYCNAFLKGLPCNNPDCLYLHDIGECPPGSRQVQLGVVTG